MDRPLLQPDEAIALSISGGTSIPGFASLIRTFGDLDSLMRQSDQTLLNQPGIGKSGLHKLRSSKKVDLQSATTRIKRAGIVPLVHGHPGYPAALYEGMTDPPLVLYAKGCTDVFAETGVAVVGTRRPSLYGERVTRQIAEDLGRFPFIVISGLATGIDGIAHRSCITAEGRTVAVLAHGLHTVHPSAHRPLAHSILNHGGALIAEYPPGTQAQKHTFVPRNRIIAGLSAATIVVEGGIKSGARHTSDFALDYGRVVLAVPGRTTDPMSALPNQLIREGRAEVCRDLADLLVSLPLHMDDGIREAMNAQAQILSRKAEKVLKKLGSDAEIVFKQIGNDPLHVDQLCTATGLSSPAVLTILLQLEIEGIVEQLPGMRYVSNLQTR